MTKSTTRKVRCVSCGEDYNPRRQHICDLTALERKKGTSWAEPQRAKAGKMMFGKAGR